MHEHVFSKMTSVTKLAIRLQNARLVDKQTSAGGSVPVSYRQDAQALKEEVEEEAWRSCLGNDTAFARKLLRARCFVTKGEAQPFRTTGTALLAYRELWLEQLGAGPTRDLLKKRVERKLERRILPARKVILLLDFNDDPLIVQRAGNRRRQLPEPV